ncbi:MAG: NAD-binding protein [Deltaproteobacteria bacterium]|nr:NAD-binding protein [Deltaproteobacteria bacterium]
MTRAEAQAFKPPTGFLEKYVSAVGSSPAISRLFDEIRSIEARDGDNNGVLVPRDLANASATIKGLMERVYAKEGGAKALPLTRIERRIAEVGIAFVNGKTFRTDPRNEAYPELVRGAVRWLAEEYRREVIEGGGGISDFFRKRGFDSRGAARARQSVPKLAPKPTLEQAANLWRKKLDGEISSTAFVEITGLSVAEGGRLEKKFPALFVEDAASGPAAKSFNGSARAAAEDFSKLLAKYTDADILIGRAQIIELANQDKGFVKKWGGVTEARYKTWQRANPELFPDLRSVSKWVPVLTSEIKEIFEKQPGLSRFELLEVMKDRHPSINKSHIELVSSKNPGLFKQNREAVLPNRAAHAEVVAALARGWATADILISREEIIRRCNDDPKLVARFGRLDLNGYKNLIAKVPSKFPKLRSREVWVPVVSADVRALLAKSPTMSKPELAKALKKKHPSLGVGHLEELSKIDKSLFAAKKAAEKSEKVYDAKLARAVKVLIEANPKISRRALAERLQPKYPWLTERGVAHLIDKLVRPVVTPDALLTVDRDPAKNSKVVQGVYDLILRLFPPGTNQDTILEALNQELEKRGVAGFNSKVYQAKRGSSVDAHVEITSRILAEYASAAPKGAPESEILNAIERDYPTLTRTGMRSLRAKIETNLRDHKELAPFVTGNKLELVGLGKRLESPRYLGGWTIERAVLGGDKAETNELAALTQFTRIPLRLPMLEAALEDLEGNQPLRTKNVLMVSHFLATTVPLALAMKRAGAELENTVMVGTPYGSNTTVVDTLRDLGFDLRVPKLSVADYRKAVEKGLDDAVARHRKNGQNVVVLDDGGLVADLLHSSSKYADVRGAFKLVEQTTGGVIVSEKHALETPIINAARSKSKMREAPYIGQAVAEKVCQGLQRIGTKLSAKKAVVIGFGTVGKELAKQLRQQGAKVVVIEPSETRRNAAKDAGFSVSESVKKHLASADVLIGCTGTRSLSIEDVRQLKPGATIASASSKQTEFPMDEVKKEARAAKPIEPDVPVVTLPSFEYSFGRKSLTVLGDGWPVNFDGDVEDIAAEDIQLTRAIMFSGALQASRLLNSAKNAGLVAYDEAEDNKILRRFETLKKSPSGAEGIRDPERWTEVVTAMARRLGALEVEGTGQSVERARAEYLSPRVAEWLKEDPFMDLRDLVVRTNRDKGYVRQFGKLTPNLYNNLRTGQGLPALRKGSAWMQVILEEIKILMKENPEYQRKDLLRDLQEKFPKLRKMHIDVLGGKFPDIVPNRNAR